MVISNRTAKPRYQGLMLLMLRFSCNNRNQQYYLKGMWTCGPPIMIVETTRN